MFSSLVKIEKLLFFGIFLLLWSCGKEGQESSSTLRVATAANMQFAMEALAAAYTTQTGTPVELMISSSGKLKAQIQEGAPYDVFVSADTLYPARLHAAGIGQGSPRIYAYGKLALWTLDPHLGLSLDSLSSTKIRHIAIANPQLAPYGRAAQEVLQGAGLWSSLTDRFVRGESISQTNQFILSGAAEVGFTALAAVCSPKLRNTGRWLLIDSSAYSPIAQAALLLNDTPEAKRYYDFLFSSPARSVLEAYGYRIP